MMDEATSALAQAIAALDATVNSTERLPGARLHAAARLVEVLFLFREWAEAIEAQHRGEPIGFGNFGAGDWEGLSTDARHLSEWAMARSRGADFSGLLAIEKLSRSS